MKDILIGIPFIILLIIVASLILETEEDDKLKELDEMYELTMHG